MYEGMYACIHKDLCMSALKLVYMEGSVELG